MNIIQYVKEKGLKRTAEVIYQYKLGIILANTLNVFLRYIPLKNMIIIESHNDFDCNGGAFYDYLIRNGYNKTYKIVWLIKNKIPKHLPENVNAVYLYKPSLKMAYYQCLAKFMLADQSHIKKMRQSQISIHLSHGAVDLKDLSGIASFPSFVDYVLSPSKNYDKELCYRYGFEYPSEKFIYLGYPSDDVLLNSGKDEIKKLTSNKYNKVFLWMSTFRKSVSQGRNDSTSESSFATGIPLFDTAVKIQRLNDELKQRNCLLIVKYHPFQDLSEVEIPRNFSNIICLTGNDVKSLGVDNYRLMACADAMISDYSSAAYSYLLLNRPIAYIFADAMSYKRLLDSKKAEKFIVGQTIYTDNDFLNFIDNVIDNKDAYMAERLHLLEWLYKYHDGNSSQRLAEFMGLKNEEYHVRQD